MTGHWSLVPKGEGEEKDGGPGDVCVEVVLNFYIFLKLEREEYTRQSLCLLTITKGHVY